MRLQLTATLMAECSTAIERDLHMVGVCAIEDKLQDGVPEAIFTLLEAGLKVWVLTGDKQETAISIAVSCNLIKEPQNMLFCNASSKSEAEQVLLDLINRCKETLYSARHPQSALRGNPGRTSSTLSRAPSTLLSVPGRYGVLEIVIDGLTLGMILGTELEDQLAFLTMQCTSVLVCRASPSQKAKVVQMVRDYKLKSSNQLSKWGRSLNRFNRHCEPKMLGIGDGANDVALLQTCDIGIGISGKEGKQAVNNSDFAIHQFRFLVKLLLVHGQANYYRLAGSSTRSSRTCPSPSCSYSSSSTTATAARPSSTASRPTSTTLCSPPSPSSSTLPWTAPSNCPRC